MKEEIIQYMCQFLEIPHSAFSGLPPCPFARKERLENRILYTESLLNEKEINPSLWVEIESLSKEARPRTLLVYESKLESSVGEVYDFARLITDQFAEQNILAIPIHPQDEYSLNGVQTRSDAPTAFVIVQLKDQVAKAKELLLGTQYYANNGDYEARFVQSFSDSLFASNPNIEFVSVWWKDEVLRDVNRGNVFPEPVVGLTLDVLDRNGVYRWLKRFGSMHGWMNLCRFQETSPKLIEACKKGEIVLCSGFGGPNKGFLSRLLWNDELQKLVHDPPNHMNQEELLAHGCWIWVG